jgi:acyl-CoA thioester hydrolase
MISYETPYRVCYADTDRMGIMYYGNYPRLDEIGRTDMIRTIWKSYREVEESAGRVHRTARKNRQIRMK